MACPVGSPGTSGTSGTSGLGVRIDRRLPAR